LHLCDEMQCDFPEETCPNPAIPMYGSVRSGADSVFYLGSLVSYTCDTPGYQITGNTVNPHYAHTHNSGTFGTQCHVATVYILLNQITT